VRALPSYDYAVVRLTPSAERGEFVNSGLVLHCLERGFLECRVHLDEARLLAMCPTLDLETVRLHLKAFARICAGDLSAGPIAKLSTRERFQWLVAPRSTMIQISEVHSGVSESPRDTFEELFRRLVLPIS
jgi:Protein of unknown function (DUF3037)